MVALRSLFLTGLVVAVNSKREIMNEDEIRGGFTPVSKITFLQSGVATETIDSLKKKAEHEVADFTLDQWQLGKGDSKYLAWHSGFAKLVALEIGKGAAFDEQVKKFEVQPQLAKLHGLVDYATTQLKTLTFTDFQNEFVAQTTGSAYLELKKKIDVSVASIKAMEKENNTARAQVLRELKATQKDQKTQLRKMAGRLDEARELYNYAKPTSDKVIPIWEAVVVLQNALNGNDDAVKDAARKGVVDAQGRVTTDGPALVATAKAFVAASVAEQKEEFAKIFADVYSNPILEVMKVGCSFAVGVVFGAFVYDRYAQKSNTVHAPGEGLV